MHRHNSSDEELLSCYVGSSGEFRLNESRQLCTDVWFLCITAMPCLQVSPSDPVLGILSGFIRLVFPITAATYLIKFAFRLGAPQKRDK